MRGLIVAVASSVIGCGAPDPIAGAEAVCDVICDCAYTLPNANEVCQTECIQDVGGIGIPDDCLDCIVSDECSWELTCQDECFVSKPLLEP